MLIKNYGLFWSAEDVFWGESGKGNKGNLLGKLPNEKRATAVNFREQTGIYVLYADYEMVYVGQTAGKDYKLFRRLSDHRKNDLAGRWNRFSWFGTRYVRRDNSLSDEKSNAQAKHKVVLDQIEAILIHVSEPPLNRQGGKWGEAEQYLQYRDRDVLGPNSSKMIEEMWEKLIRKKAKTM